MNKPTPKRYYWDACVFLAGISGEPGRVDVVAQLLEEAEKGECLIFTSMLSITEVAFATAEKLNAAPDATVETNIDALWHPSSPVKLVELDVLVANEARRLIRDARFKYQFTLKPADALHLASAQRLGVDEFHTYDDLHRYSALTGLRIVEPAVTQKSLFSSTMPLLPPST